MSVSSDICDGSKSNESNDSSDSTDISYGSNDTYLCKQVRSIETVVKSVTVVTIVK